MRNGAVSLVFLLLASPVLSCMQYEVRGGPRNDVIVTTPGSFADDVGPLVAESRSAREKIKGIRSARTTSIALSSTGMASVAIAGMWMGLGSSASSRGDYGTAKHYYIAAAAQSGVGLILSLIAIMVAPGPSDYRSVIDFYNKDYPRHPYRFSEVGKSQTDTQ